MNVQSLDKLGKMERNEFSYEVIEQGEGAVVDFGPFKVTMLGKKEFKKRQAEMLDFHNKMMYSTCPGRMDLINCFKDINPQK